MSDLASAQIEKARLTGRVDRARDATVEAAGQLAALARAGAATEELLRAKERAVYLTAQQLDLIVEAAALDRAIEEASK